MPSGAITIRRSAATADSAFASEIENEPSRIRIWDRVESKLIEPAGLNDSPNAQLWPSLSGDGGLLVFAAWNRPNSSARWDLLLLDLARRGFVPLGEINTLAHDERMPALSGDGRWLAFVTNGPGAGLMDVALADLSTRELVALPDLNSQHREVEPSLSADGRLVAFVSDRPGGAGGRDIYLYDCQTRGLVELAGLNSVAQEQSPSLSPDGRYLAFVSERLSGEGERDIFLYDVAERRLLATPGLNARQEDLDPCIVVPSASGRYGVACGAGFVRELSPDGGVQAGSGLPPLLWEVATCQFPRILGRPQWRRP